MFLKRLWWTAYLAYHWRGQARYPFKPLDAIRHDQARRVQQTVAYAYRFVPYYRETMQRLGLTPADFRTADDLAKLPVLERAEFQSDPERFVSSAVRLDRCSRERTSGSSGRPITFYRERTVAIQTAAHSERTRSIITALAGRRFTYRETRIFSSGAFIGQRKRRWKGKTMVPRGFPVRGQLLSIFDPPEKNVPLINAFKPHVLLTAGSYLGMLFPYVHASGVPFHVPKVVIYGGDMLAPSVRRLIENEFKAHVLCTYQCIEAMRIAWECEHHAGLHMNMDLCPVRIVDEAGRALPVGEVGDVVISNLVDRATVLLNYRLGDLAALLPDPGPCGRSLPMMSLPQGRRNDCIELPAGRSIHSCIMNRLFDKVEDIWQWQAVQETLSHFRLAVVAGENCDRAQLRERVLAWFAEWLGQGVTVDLSFVDSIERTAAGKLRTVISKMRRPGADDAGPPAPASEDE